SIPGIIPAVEYDIGAWGLSYTDSDYYNNGDGNYNDGWSFRNDGVDIEANGDSDGLPYNIGWTDAGEWLKFTIQDVTPGTYDLKIRVAAPSSGGIFFAQLNGANLGVIDVPSTGGWYEWQNMVIPNVEVSSGEQFLKIQIVQAGFNIERIIFESVNNSIDDPVILDQFMLGEPYPNPFNPSVMMDLTNHEPSKYTISIINLKGEKIYHKSLGVLEPGKHSLNWDGVNFNGKSVTSGVYLMIISDRKMSLRKKLVLLR
ncbi:MAG: carbohydrate-binding protein, partial [Candidatus Marinimicrobia bacterium]|nr:carbohydrate-binding protein [Candidatus Neomarinimicrobiota bacterium]